MVKIWKGPEPFNSCVIEAGNNWPLGHYVFTTMQLITLYSDPRRLLATTDTSGFNTENRLMYQRKTRLYKGIDNTIEFEIKNSDSRRKLLAGYSLIANFYDADHKLLFSTTGNPILSKTGIVSLTVPLETLESIDPQTLFLGTFLRTLSNDEILYIDSQFSLFYEIQLADGFNTTVKDAIVDLFIWDKGTGDWVSEITDFRYQMNSDNSSIEITVFPNEEDPFLGMVQVEVADDKSLAIGNTWTKLLPIDLASSTTSQLYTGDWRFLRLRYNRYDLEEYPEKHIPVGLIDHFAVRTVSN